MSVVYNYDIDSHSTGPCEIFLMVDKPGASAEVTIDYDSATGRFAPSTASGANANALHLGLIKDGVDITHKSSVKEFTAHQLTGAYREKLTQEEAMIHAKGALLPGGDYDLAAAILQGATLSNPTGKRKLDGGGSRNVTYITVLAIWARLGDPTKYDYELLYRARNIGDYVLTLDNENESAIDVNFKGFPDVSRPPGKQIWQRVTSET